MVKIKTTDEKIDALAVAVKNGFDGVYQKLDGVEKRLTQRIEILEHRVLSEHATRLEILEDDMRKVKTKLGVS